MTACIQLLNRRLNFAHQLWISLDHQGILTTIGNNTDAIAIKAGDLTLLIKTVIQGNTWRGTARAIAGRAVTAVIDQTANAIITAVFRIGR